MNTRKALEYELTIDGNKTKKAIGKRDQFAPELLYFSDCVLRDRTPEPSGEEGMQDVRIVEALYESARTRKAVQIPPFSDRRPTKAQKMRKPGVRKPRLVNAVSSGVD